MPKKESTIVNALLFALDVAKEIMPMIMVSPYQRGRRLLYGNNYNSYRNTVYNLQKRGSIKIISKEGKKFLQLTKKGKLEVLLAKARMPLIEKWDGKWRLIMFDIPEDAKQHRDRLRDLLKRNNFYKLQESVYINPQPLNREAIRYLQETELIRYIRILKVEEMDNDIFLKKKFGLQ
jgi:CRISPR-associated endonuclease Cas2